MARTQRVEIWVALTMATACATTGPPPVATPEAPEPPLGPPGELARNWLLPSAISSAAGPLDAEALYDQLLDARVIYVAEAHDNHHDHAVQLQVIDGIFRRDPSLAIGMEMFKRPFQKWVSDYVEGRIDEARMLEKTEWDKRWGFDYALYRPIIEYAREHKIRILAINERDEVTRQVAREGLASLDPVDRDGIPDLDLGQPEHRARIKEIYDGHGGSAHHHLGEFEDFYAAQVIWDETMSYEVARELSLPDAPKRIVVIAGGGHIVYKDAIPLRAEKRGATPFKTVLPVVIESSEEGLEAKKEGRGDYLWLMAKTAAILPK